MEPSGEIRRDQIEMEVEQALILKRMLFIMSVETAVSIGGIGLAIALLNMLTS